MVSTKILVAIIVVCVLAVVSVINFVHPFIYSSGSSDSSLGSGVGGSYGNPIAWTCLDLNNAGNVTCRKQNDKSWTCLLSPPNSASDLRCTTSDRSFTGGSMFCSKNSTSLWTCSSGSSIICTKLTKTSWSCRIFAAETAKS